MRRTTKLPSMKSTPFRLSVIVITALLSVTGCSDSYTVASASQSLTPQLLSGPIGWPSSKKRARPILFVADFQGNVHSKGSLYVSNVEPTKGSITVYSPGVDKPRLKISSPGFYGLAVDSKGDIFGSYTGGLVFVYKPGTKKPYKKIRISGNPASIAVDSKDNAWVADNSGSRVWIIHARTYQVTQSALKGLQQPIGLSFGSNDELYVSNFASNKVSVYKIGSNSPAFIIAKGIATPTLNGITATGIFFQSNQQNNVVGYKAGLRLPFSTIVGSTDPLGIASSPLVKR